MGPHDHIRSGKPGRIFCLVPLDIESILHLACRMVRAKIERIKIMPLRFHLRPFCYLPPHRNKEIFNIFKQFRQRMPSPYGMAAYRLCHVHCFSGQFFLLFLLFKLIFTRTISTAKISTEAADKFACIFFLIRAETAYSPARTCKFRGTAGILGTESIQFIQIRSISNFPDTLIHSRCYSVGIKFKNL